MILIVLTVALCVFLMMGVTEPYDTGPPIRDETCTSMSPFHPPSVSLDNVEFEVIGNLCYTVRQNLTVNIRKAGSQKAGFVMSGIMVQAKKPGITNDNYGTFDIKDARKLKVSDCFLKSKSVLHHIAKLNQTSLSFHWNAPQEDEGDLEFLVTLVFSYESFITSLKIPLPVCTNATTDTTAYSTANETTAATKRISAEIELRTTATAAIPTTIQSTVAATTTMTPTTTTATKTQEKVTPLNDRSSINSLENLVVVLEIVFVVVIRR